MSWAEIVTFALVAALLVMSPGPNGVLIAKTVPTSGRAAGFANVAGFVTAFYLHGALSILGLSVILVQSALAFTVVKTLGAAYLFWLGVKALKAAWQGGAPTAEIAPARQKRRLRRAYVEGLLTNALNPKVSMFYLAAFPQFISPHVAGSEVPILASFSLVMIHALINAIWFGAMVLLFDRLANRLSGGRFQRWLKGVTGVIFVGFAAKLASVRSV